MKKKYIGIGVGVLIVSIVLGYYTWYLPEIKEIATNISLDAKAKVDAINTVKGRYTSILGGLIAVVALYFNWLRTNAIQKQIEQTEKQINNAKIDSDKKNDIAQAQLIESGKNNDNNYWLSQFAKASELLKDEALASRLSGIYLFEKIMNNNEEYHWAVIEILSAYVREKRNIEKFLRTENYFKHSTDGFTVALTDYALERIKPSDKSLKYIELISVEEDVIAILRVLGKRNMSFENHPISKRNINNIAENILTDKSQRKPQKDKDSNLKVLEDEMDKMDVVNLDNIFLLDAQLNQLNFDYISFHKSYFSNCKFYRTSFRLGTLYKANFNDESVLLETNFQGAYLKEAIFDQIQLLTKTDFSFSECESILFYNCTLDDTCFDKAFLGSAEFSRTKVHTKASMKEAYLQNSKFVDSNLSSLNLHGADLFYSEFTGLTTLDNACFSDVILEGINFCEVGITVKQLLDAKTVKGCNFSLKLVDLIKSNPNAIHLLEDNSYDIKGAS